MPSYFSEEEYDQILSRKSSSAPARSGGQGVNFEKLGDVVSPEEFDRLVADSPRERRTPQPAISRMAEGAKGLARGTLELATSIGGAGVEMAGQIGTSVYDAFRLPQYFPGTTPQSVLSLGQASRTIVPTDNPLEGQTEIAKRVFRPDMPALQPDPRTTPENAPYIQWGGPGGWVPTPQMGVAQQARLFGEAGSMVPAAAGTTLAAAATGGIGPAGAFAGGAMGGAFEALSEYQQILEDGGTQSDALRGAGIMFGGAGAFNAIPFVAYSTKFLPKGMRNSVGKAMISFVAEGMTETAEGGVSAISRINKFPKSAEEWAEAYRKVEQGVIDESNVFLVAGLMGGGTSMLSKDDTQPQTPPPSPTATEPNTPRYDPRVTPGRPEDNTDLDELEPAIRDWLLNTSDQTTIKIKGKTYKGRAKVSEAPPQTREDAIDVTATPVDSLRPGPNAPTQPSTKWDSFEDDNTPWVPQEPPAAAPVATNAPAPIVPAPEQQVAPEASVEQLSPEYQALLDENPELAAALKEQESLLKETDALMSQPRPARTAAEYEKEQEERKIAWKKESWDEFRSYDGDKIEPGIYRDNGYAGINYEVERKPNGDLFIYKIERGKSDLISRIREMGVDSAGVKFALYVKQNFYTKIGGPSTESASKEQPQWLTEALDTLDAKDTPEARPVLDVGRPVEEQAGELTEDEVRTIQNNNQQGMPDLRRKYGADTVRNLVVQSRNGDPLDLAKAREQGAAQAEERKVERERAFSPEGIAERQAKELAAIEAKKKEDIDAFSSVGGDTLGSGTYEDGELELVYDVRKSANGDILIMYGPKGASEGDMRPYGGVRNGVPDANAIGFASYVKSGSIARADATPQTAREKFLSRVSVRAQDRPRPGNRTPEQVPSPEELPAGVKYDPNLKYEADVHSNRGSVTVGPKFFERTPEERKHILAHEQGHDLSDAMLKDGTAFDLADNGAFGPKDPETGYIRGINGQSTPGENIAEAFAVYKSEPEWLKSNYPEVYKAIDERVSQPEPQTAREKFLSRVSVRAQDRPRPGNRTPEQVPSPEVRTTVRNRSQKGVAPVVQPDIIEPDVMEPTPATFDIETIPMEQMDAFMADEDAKITAKEQAVARKYLTPEQLDRFNKLPDTNAGYRLREKMLENVSEQAANEFADTNNFDDLDAASKYRKVRTIKERLENDFQGEDETIASQELTRFLRNANFNDPVDTRTLIEAAKKYKSYGIDINKVLARARESYRSFYLNQTGDPTEADYMLSSLDEMMGITSEPAPESTQPEQATDQRPVYRAELPEIGEGKQLGGVQDIGSVMGIKARPPRAPFEFFTYDKEDADHYGKRDSQVLESYKKQFGDDAENTFEVLHGFKPRSEYSLKEEVPDTSKTLDLTGIGDKPNQSDLLEVVNKILGLPDLPENWRQKDIPQEVEDTMEKYGLLHLGDEDGNFLAWELFRNNQGAVGAALHERDKNPLDATAIQGNLFAQFLEDHGYNSVRHMHNSSRGPIEHFVKIPEGMEYKKYDMQRQANGLAKWMPRAESTAPEAPQPAATFKGMQPRPRGQSPVPLYNIPDGKGGQTTVSAETAAAQGYSVPEPPAEAVEAPKDPESQFQEDIRAISAESKEKRLKDLRREFMQNKGLSHTQENGIQQILHMSSKKSGSFQLSSIGADGIPNMDQEFDNISEAIAEFDRTVGKRRADLPDIAMMLKPGEANFIYEPRLRPVDIGTIPKEGFVGRREGGKWGRAAFNRPLTEKELDQYELTPVGYEDNTGGSGLIEGAMNEQPKPTQPLTATANRAAMPEQRDGTNYEKTLGAIGDTLAGNKGVVADVAQSREDKLLDDMTAIMDSGLDEVSKRLLNGFSMTHPNTSIKDVLDTAKRIAEHDGVDIVPQIVAEAAQYLSRDLNIKDNYELTKKQDPKDPVLSRMESIFEELRSETPAPTTQEKVQALREKAGEKAAQEPIKQPYEMTSEEYFQSELAKNKYKDKYEQDPKALKLFHDQKDQEWMDMLHAQAEVDALPLNVIDDYAAKFGESFLFRNFRGKAAKGIEGWAPSDVRRVGSNDDTFFGFMDDMNKLRAGAAKKALNAEKALPGGKSTVRRWIDKLYNSKELSVSTDTKNKMSKSDREHLEAMRARPGGLAPLGNIPNKYLAMEAKEKTAYYVNGIDLGKTAYDYAQFRLASEADTASQRITPEPAKEQPAPAPAPKRTKAKAPSKWLGGMDVAEEAKKPKRGGDEAGYINLGAVAEIPGIVLEAATKPVVFEQGFGAAKPAVAERRAKLKSFELRGKHIAMDFDNGFRKLYKRLNPGLKGKLVNRFASIPDKIVNQLNDYLEAADPDMKAELLMELPPELRQPAVKMRELVDNMTDYMLSLGIVEDEQGMAFADNKGVYLRRTYDIFTDPDFRERRDPRLKETLRKWLQKEYPEYSKEEINGIITDLDGTGLSATSTNNMIARGKALGQMDRRTLGKREDIPQEVMDFWGVSRNGYDRFLDTINSQAHIIANYEFLSNMAENLDGISVATASTLRDIKQGTYKGDSADEIMSWPYLNDADTARSIRRMSRKRETVEKKEQAIETALNKLSKLPDSAKKTELLTKLRDDALMLKLGLKRNKAGVMSVDPENLEAAAKYLEDLTAEISSRGKKKDKETTKLRKDLDKYTRQYNKAEGAAATDEKLPNMFGSFGPLAGARIHPDLKKALQDALAIKERSEFVDALRGINSQMKQNVTTRNPASAVRNLTSGFDFSMANGWILYGNSVKRLKLAMEIASVDITRSHNPKWRDTYLRLVGLGVTADTVVMGDITATAANAKKPKMIRDFIRKYPEIAAAMGGPDAVAQKLYQAGDDVFKIFGWLTETEHLMDIGMSRREAEVEAAQRVRNQFPTYSELPKWAQWFKASPVVGPFVAYKTETYRTAYNTVVQAVTEVKSKDPKVRRMGYRRLAGIGAASISRNSIKIMLLAMLGIDPDDEDAIQMAAPVFYQDHTIGITKANKAKGLYEGYNLSTSDAYNVLKEPMYAAIRGEGVGETVGNAAVTIGRDYISPEMGASLIAELLANIQGKSSTIFKKSDTAGEKWLKSAMRVGLDVGVPGGARGFLKAETPEDMINETVTQFTGLKTIKIDMPNDLLYKARALTSIPREQATDVYKYIRAKDKDGANAEIAKVNATRKDQFMVVHKAYRAYASAGTRADLLDDALKQAGLSQKSINSVKYGMYEDWEGSKPMKEALGQ